MPKPRQAYVRHELSRQDDVREKKNMIDLCSLCTLTHFQLKRMRKKRRWRVRNLLLCTYTLLNSDDFTFFFFNNSLYYLNFRCCCCFFLPVNFLAFICLCDHISSSLSFLEANRCPPSSRLLIWNLIFFFCAQTLQHIIILFRTRACVDHRCFLCD